MEMVCADCSVGDSMIVVGTGAVRDAGQTLITGVLSIVPGGKIAPLPGVRTRMMCGVLNVPTMPTGKAVCGSTAACQMMVVSRRVTEPIMTGAGNIVGTRPMMMSTSDITARMSGGERRLGDVLVMLPLEAATAANATVTHATIEMTVVRRTAEVLNVMTASLATEVMLRGAIVMLRGTVVVSAAKAATHMVTAIPAATEVMAPATESSMVTAATPHVASTPASVSMTCRQI